MKLSRLTLSLICLVSFSFSQASQVAPRWIVVRHGQADHNVQDQYNSNPFHPQYRPSHLTAIGIKQAQQAAKTLLAQHWSPKKITQVLVSPLPRARETANILAKIGVIYHHQIRIEPLLTESQAGDREGQKHKSNEDRWDHSLAHEYHGETDNDMQTRIKKFVEKANQDYPTGTLMVVTHGSPAQALILEHTGEKVRLPTAGFQVL